MLLCRAWRPLCQARSFAPATKAPHRIRNERKQAKEKLTRLLKMQDRSENDDLLWKLQELILPEKTGASLDRPALTAKLRLLANLCEAEHQLEELPEDRNEALQQTQASRKKARRAFDYNEYRTRFVALHVFYLGWDYLGFASQDTGKTIENALIRALKRTKLIPEDYAHSKDISYSKAGRTDKGVSALGQVISLTVRSRRKVHEPEATVEEEFDYPAMLNAALPPEIRVWGWTPVEPDFSARYSPLSRTYKYFIVTDEIEGLDIPLMQKSCQELLGVRNFQNLCKMNLDQTANHEREILEVGIEPIENVRFPRCSFFVFTIRGSAFLWHQVRCIMAVLLLIGRGLESADVLTELLDVEKTLSKPLYNPASEVPLVLWEADYGEEVVPFRRSHFQLKKNRSLLRHDIRNHLTQLLVMHHLYEVLLSTSHDGPLHMDRTPAHIPLLKRQREPSFAERMEKHMRKHGPI